jgi:hypothetical protein
MMGLKPPSYRHWMSPHLAQLRRRVLLGQLGGPGPDGDDEVVPVLRGLPGLEVRVAAEHLLGEHGHGDHGRVVR